MKLTIEKREAVAKQEAKKKYDKIIEESKAKIGNYLETLVKKKARVFDKELVESGYLLMTRVVVLKLPKELQRSELPYKGYKYGPTTTREYSFNMEEQYATKVHVGTFSYEVDAKSEKLVIAFHKLKDDKKAFEKELMTLLNSFSTVKQLLDHVPEMEGYFPPDKKVSTDLVPMELVKKMRKHFKQSSINITAKTPSTELAQLH